MMMKIAIFAFPYPSLMNVVNDLYEHKKSRFLKYDRLLQIILGCGWVSDVSRSFYKTVNLYIYVHTKTACSIPGTVIGAFGLLS